MKKILIRFRLVFWTTSALSFGLSGCNNEPEEGPASVISFEEKVYVFSESDVFAFIPIELDRPQFGYVSYNLNSTDVNETTNQGEDAEVRVGPFPARTIYGGNLYTGMYVSIYNDIDLDGPDEIEVELEPKTTNAKAHSEFGKVRIIIQDDDDVPPNELRIHANWLPVTYGTAVRSYISKYEITLNVLYDVVLDENGIAESKIFRQSAHTDKYQDIVLLESDPDQEYYIQFVYEGVHGSVKNPAITGKLKLNGFGHADETINVWNFSLDEDGYYVYLGPFKKEGATFTLLED